MLQIPPSLHKKKEIVTTHKFNEEQDLICYKLLTYVCLALCPTGVTNMVDSAHESV